MITGKDLVVFIRPITKNPDQVDVMQIMKISAKRMISDNTGIPKTFVPMPVESKNITNLYNRASTTIKVAMPRIHPRKFFISLLLRKNTLKTHIYILPFFLGGADIFLDSHTQLLSVLKRAEPSEC